MNEYDPFKEYYRITFNEQDQETPEPDADKDGLSFLDDAKDEKRELITDAKEIRGSVNELVRGLGATVARMIYNEKRKGTEPDLIETIILGSLAFVGANTFYIIREDLKSKMSAEEYEATFIKMFQAAIVNIKKDRGE